MNDSRDRAWEKRNANWHKVGLMFWSVMLVCAMAIAMAATVRIVSELLT